MKPKRRRPGKAERRCVDCGDRYAQEFGRCRLCQAARLALNTPDTRRCPTCSVTAPHPRCTRATGHEPPHDFGAIA